MYQVVCYLDGKEHVLLDPRDENYILDTPKLTLQVNSAGSMTFKIYKTHPEFTSIKPLLSIIKVYRIKNGTKNWLFSGRVISSEKDLYNTGKVKCEGLMAYLLDSIVYPYEFQGTPANYVTQLIESHNSQVGTEKQIAIRTLDLADIDSNNNIVRANKNYPTTHQELKDKVIKNLGAYVSVEENNGTIYLDCTQSITVYNAQPIRLGENILELKQTKSADSIKTVMIGIGEEDEDGVNISVTVENAEAIKKYGRIVGTKEFEDVTTMEQLTKKTKAYLDSTLEETDTVEVKVIDLNMVDSAVEDLRLGYAYVESSYNNLNNERMLISKMDIYLMQPDKNTITLGVNKASITSSLSHSSTEINRKVKRIASSISPRINSAVENASQLITGAKGGYVILDCGDNADKHPEQILVMDAPDKKTATNIIRINKNGIGFSTSGYGGPYANAWTIDGNLVADFITTGTMFADRIRGGTLEIGGEKNGVISVLNNKGIEVARLDVNGLNVKKGTISGATVTVGGQDNTDGAIYVKDGSNIVRITLDKNGINVNNAFSVDMSGTITAIGIKGNAVQQFSNMIEQSEAMRLAREAITAAQNAANTAGSAASQAQQAASTANGAAATAQKTAEQAASTANVANTTVTNLTQTVIPDINNSIENLSNRVSALGG